MVNLLERFQISRFFSKTLYNNSNFLDFSLSNYSVTVALLCFFFVTIINVFSFSYEVNSWVQINILNGLELAVAAIQTSVGVTKIVNVFSILIFIG